MKSLRQSICKGEPCPTCGEPDSTIHVDVKEHKLDKQELWLFYCAGQVNKSLWRGAQQNAVRSALDDQFSLSMGHTSGEDGCRVNNHTGGPQYVRLLEKHGQDHNVQPIRTTITGTTRMQQVLRWLCWGDEMSRFPQEKVE